MITSSQNPKLKLVRALMGRAKERREANAFVVEGVRLVEEAINSHWKLRFVLYDETLSERGKSQVESLKLLGVEVDEIPTSLMKSISETETPQGILAVLEFTQLPIANYPDFILIPDRIRDPGNLGTLLRSAAATGVQAVFLPPETTDAFAPKVLRAGMGAQFRLPIHEMEWEQIERIVTSANLQLYVADMNGVSCWETDLRKPLALVIGGEAEGASKEAQRLAHGKISIPMTGGVESLNAGVAGSVLMFEVVRQRTSNQ
ncbi:MAG: TrmH family RNA methyltransferase [Chloroflexota bacterium]|nr:RNA methyltransferase [Chloroflexota bacterium]MBI5702393.1 RNA methyltransferase [Chloroflexota bacterium]